MERLPIFVYGTLKPGYVSYTRFLAGRTAAESGASLSGAALYTPGPFPFLVELAELVQPGDTVQGVLITLRRQLYEPVLAEMDRLEDYVPGRGALNMYERVVRKVQTAGGPVQAWLYLAGPRATALIGAGRMRKVADGSW